MLTAQQKKKENIAEYILYMWHVESIIRANNCDMDLIRRNVLPSYSSGDQRLNEEIEDWWDNLCIMLKHENKQLSGHLQVLINTVNDVNNLHLRLLHSDRFIPYHMKFQALVPILKELETKTLPKPSNDIELMLSALYNSFLLRLKKMEISRETEQALKEFASFMALLSKYYKDDQNGDLELEDKETL